MWKVDGALGKAPVYLVCCGTLGKQSTLSQCTHFKYSSDTDYLRKREFYLKPAIIFDNLWPRSRLQMLVRLLEVVWVTNVIKR